jgi:CDP-L-myo-inositol myo-inositolphosphotransferase
MADHVVEPALYEALAQEEMRGDLTLAVDYKLDDVFDMDDATKVKVGPSAEILEIDKELTSFDAVDTGVFRCNEGLFDALQAVYDQDGDASLSQGVKMLASRDRAHVTDVGSAWWQDVDDLSTRDEAERRLFASLTKAGDGFVSRHLNRPISKMISRRLMKTSVSPNVVTAMALLIGLLSALANLCVDATHLWLLAVGGTLFHISSVIDGVDGELARLKFQFSPFGAWFDTISDVIINVSYLFTLGFAVWRVTSEPIWVMMSALSLVLALASVLSISRTLKQKGETYLPAMAWSFNDKRDCQTLFQKICRHFAFAARRDFYAFALMVLSFFGIAVAQASVTLTLIIVSFAFGQTLRTQLKLQAQREEIALPERRSTAQLAALKEQTA